MPIPDFKKKLADVNSPEHGALLKHLLSLVDISRGVMSQHYASWDLHDRAFRAERAPDKEDRDSVAKGQPKKLTVPLTFSQVMTFVAFNVSTLTQNRRFFELEPTGTEDNPLREPLEHILERDLRRNQWQTFLVQAFLDIARFSLCAAEVGWVEQTRKVKTTQTVEKEGPFGTMESSTTEGYVDAPVFSGNRVFPISPYRFLPDTRLPLSRYQEGEFCGSEDMFSMASLRADASLFNLDKIPKMTDKMYSNRRKVSRIDEMPTRLNPNEGTNSSTDLDGDAMVKSGPLVVTKMVFDLKPSDFKVNEVPLSDEDFVLRFVAWIGNDQTIIRFEEATYLHGQFPYISAQYIPDQHRTVNMGLAETCEQITGLITWLINAHVAAQKGVINGGKFLIDPAGIDIKALESNSPYMFLKKNASQTGVDRYIKQFITQDPTQNFLGDATGLKGLLGEVSGYNETMNGQYSAGRRSATQDRVVAQGGAARGKTTLSGIWDSMFEPLGKQLISNNRQMMEKDAFTRILGQGPFGPAEDSSDQLFTLFQADPVTIATAEDFFVFDATIPSEKAFLAQSLQEIFMMMMQNPQVSAVLGYGPEQMKAMLNDIYNLRGVTPSRLPVPMAPQAPVQPNVVPMLQQAQAEPVMPTSATT